MLLSLIDRERSWLARVPPFVTQSDEAVTAADQLEAVIGRWDGGLIAIGSLAANQSQSRVRPRASRSTVKDMFNF